MFLHEYGRCTGTTADVEFLGILRCWKSLSNNLLWFAIKCSEICTKIQPPSSNTAIHVTKIQLNINQLYVFRLRIKLYNF